MEKSKWLKWVDGVTFTAWPIFRLFDQAARLCISYVKRMPVTFLLGFYVSTVVNHWWEQLKAIPWPDRLSLELYFLTTTIASSIIICFSICCLLTCMIPGMSKNEMKLKRTIGRYLVLGLVIRLREMGAAAKKRFPTLHSLVQYGTVQNTNDCCS